MTGTVAPKLAAGPAAQRRVVYRTPGRRHGPITRLMSPGDLGQVLKPFIFLDLFESEGVQGDGFAPHPHSGIATVTLFLEGRGTYADSTGKSGAQSKGAVEWMQAGAGVWHTGKPDKGEAARGYQLWLALPPGLELAPAESLYLEPHEVQSEGPARLILGAYAGMTSRIASPSPLTYLHVRLQDGERWTYQPAADHDLTWLALNSGKLHLSGEILERELAVFEDGPAGISMVAEGPVEMVIGSAARQAHALVTGHYSVHTHREALMRGEANIAGLEHTPAVAALQAR